MHCTDLHFRTYQARRCWECGEDESDSAALPEQHPKQIPWQWKMDHRSDGPWTPSEHLLWHSLKRALPGVEVLAQWWVDGLPYKVDFLIPAIGLVVEVDGASHLGRESEDRRRSAYIRQVGYDISRATALDVVSDADRIAAQIASRFGPSRPEPIVTEEFDESAAA